MDINMMQIDYANQLKSLRNLKKVKNRRSVKNL